VRGPLVVIGDAMLDIDVDGHVSRLCPDAPVPVLDDGVESPRPGGAGLAAAMAAADGHEVVLIAPWFDDEDGAKLRRLLEPALRLVPLALPGTTAVKRRIRASGQTLVRLDSGRQAGMVGELPAAAIAALRSASVVLVADYGRGLTASPQVRDCLRERVRDVPVVWDPHPRGEAPVAGVHLATPNAAEVAMWAGRHGISPAIGSSSLAALTDLTAGLVSAWRSRAVAVTLGERGALLSYGGDAPVIVPAPIVVGGDTCGAGDRFAVTAAKALGSGLVTAEAVQAAVHAASEHVAQGGAAAFARSRGDVRAPDRGELPAAAQVVASVRAGGGVVVATGGCFDLLHAGHVATLRSARTLGDCLVVCINSDASIARLKGPGRPVVCAADRARVLQALGCVDAVLVFDEDTPDVALRRLRPDIWAKGGDYAGSELPESQTLRSWGGQAVVLPYVEGRSTTSLVRNAATSLVATPSITAEESCP